MTKDKQIIPDRSRPGSTTTVTAAVDQPASSENFVVEDKCRRRREEKEGRLRVATVNVGTNKGGGGDAGKKESGCMLCTGDTV